MKQKLKKISVICIILILPICLIALNNIHLENKNNITIPINSNVKKAKVDVKIKKVSIQDTINILCSNKFEGRKVGTKGNDYTVKYITDTFKDLKLDFVFNKSYSHKFPCKVLNETQDGEIEIKAQNVVGKIAGSDKKRAVIISAHLDHIGIRDGNLYRGALDNASGVSSLLEIAQILKEKSEKNLFDFDIIICAFNGEESLLSGSKAFVKDIKTQYSKLYNINIDCIGSVDGGNLALKNISRIKGYSDKLYNGMKIAMKNNKIEFSNKAVSEKAFIYNVGVSDYHSFEKAGIPNIFIAQENTKPLVHRITDVPKKLDYNKIKKISDAICDFIEADGSNIFQ